jgi:prepilin-type N-terminal cleavage/methylation domain-containing protein
MGASRVKNTHRAFTLAELLVVLAIVAVVAGIMFPVFLTVKASAKKTQCISNLRQISQATLMYASDYDDYFVLVNHQPAEEPNSHNDRTWVQMILPYIHSFGIFQCPSDASDRPKPETSFDQDLVPGDIYSQFYSASLRTNAGYNFEYLAPIVKIRGEWTALPKQTESIGDPSGTLMFVDSVFSVKNGRPEGGGSWLVVPPCRYEEHGGVVVDSFTSSPASRGAEVFSPNEGWDLLDQIDSPGLLYGGAWPWHSGHMNVARTDGSVRTMSLQSLTAGCDLQENWRGEIVNDQLYMWDTQ